MKFPGRSQLDNPYPDLVRGQNLTQAAEARRLEDEARENATRLAVAKYWLGDEVPREDVTPIGRSGRRFKVEGFEYELRLSEEYLDAHADPREAGCVCYFWDADGGVHYLRKPRGLDSGTGLGAAVVGGELRGNMFLTEDGKARRLR